MLPSQTIEKVDIVEVIQIRFLRGSGGNGNELRTVTQYWSKDGRLVFEIDPLTSPN